MDLMGSEAVKKEPPNIIVLVRDHQRRTQRELEKCAVNYSSFYRSHVNNSNY